MSLVEDNYERDGVSQLNTSAHCLFCSNPVPFGEKRENEKEMSSQTISVFVRCLRINLTEIFTGTNEAGFEESLRGLIELCEQCTQICSSASKQLLQLEKLRMEVGYSVNQVWKRIEGTRNKRRNNNEIATRILNRISSECSKIASKIPLPTIPLTGVDIDVTYSKDGSKTGSIFPPTARRPSTTTNLGKISTGTSIDTTIHLNKIDIELIDDYSPDYSPQPISPAVNDDDGHIVNENLSSEDNHSEQSEGRNDADTFCRIFEDGNCSNQIISEPIQTQQQSLVLSSSSKKSHEKLSEKQESVICNICKRTFGSGVGLRNHIAYVHQKSLQKCDKCEKVYFKIAHLLRHQKEAHSGISYPCSFHNCSESFSSVGALESHNQVKHSAPPETDTKKEQKCDQCGKICLTNIALRQHRRRRHPGTQFQCNFPGCSMKYAKKGNLISHKKAVHWDPLAVGSESAAEMEKDYKCDECDEAFENSNKLRDHRIQVHSYVKREMRKKGIGDPSGSGEQKCEQCDKTFSNNSALRQHRRRFHLGSRFQCTFPGCSMKYASNKNLIKHRRDAHQNLQ